MQVTKVKIQEVQVIQFEKVGKLGLPFVYSNGECDAFRRANMKLVL